MVDEGIGLCDLAHKLGYDHEQNLYSLLRASDVHTGLIDELAKTLGKPIGEWLLFGRGPMRKQKKI